MSSFINMKELKQRVEALSAGTEFQLEGASEEEIQELEAYAGGPLPDVYKLFLKEMGHSAGKMFRGTDYSLTQRARLRFRKRAEELLEKTSYRLSQTAFVFLMSQGYQFSYFHIDQGDDPSVYHFLQGNAEPTLLDQSLSNYLLRCVEAYEDIKG